MKPIIRFSVKNSLFVNLVSVIILIAGAITILSMRREAFPNVNYDVVMVQTRYFGASPEEVEKLITIDLEDEINEVQGIDEMMSISAENFSVIVLKLDPDEENKDKVANDIQRAVDRVDLPEEADDPQVDALESKNFPVINVSLSGDFPEKELRETARRLEMDLLDLPDVARIDRTGWRDREIWVEVDPEKIWNDHISLEQILGALQNQNLNVPGGTLTDHKNQDFQVRTLGEFETPEEIGEVIVRANDLGNWIRVKDVARVRDTFEDDEQIERTRGKPAITLTVVKKEKGDILKLVRDVKKTVTEFKKGTPSGLEISYFDDFSYYVNRRLNVLKNNGLIGIFFLVGSLLLFLTRRVALVTAIGIPTAICLTFIFMHAAGLTLNLITMFALIMILGMTVDDAIIICENVYRHMEMGKSPKQAAIEGASEVAAPVISILFTTVIAFAPLLFMGGIMGKFISVIPIVVFFTLSASMIESFLILPSHLADFVRATPGGDKLEKASWYIRFRDWYTRKLQWFLVHRYKALGIFAGIFAGSILLCVFGMKFVLFPQGMIEEFLIHIKTPVETSLQETADRVVNIEKLVGALPSSDLDNYVTRVGIVRENVDDPYADRGAHLAQVHVYLTPEQTRGRRHTDTIISELRSRIDKDFKGDFEKVSFEKVRAGPPVGKPVSIRLRGEQFESLKNASELVRKYLEEIDGVLDVESDFDSGKPEVRVKVDPRKASLAGLTLREVATSVRYAFDGGVATKIRKTDEQIDVIVRFAKETTRSREIFEKIRIPNKAGDLIPLSRIAELQDDQGIRVIKHFDRRRVIYVTASVEEKKVTALDVQRNMSDFARRQLAAAYPDVSLTFGGEQEETSRSMGDFVKAMLFALLTIFVILAGNFNSIIRPLLVMSAIPFGIVGVIFAFFLHGQPLSFMAMLGVIGLTGVVVNDSIVLVSFMAQLREEGMGRMESIVEAGRTRLRPVLLTSITTCVNLFPLAYGIGGSDPFLRPMGLAIAWGLLFATVLTLILVPCLYAVADDVSGLLKTRKLDFTGLRRGLRNFGARFHPDSPLGKVFRVF